MIFFLSQMAEGKHERIAFTANDEERARLYCEERGFPASWEEKKLSVLSVDREFSPEGAFFTVPVDRSVARVRDLLDVAAPNWEATFSVVSPVWGEIHIQAAGRVERFATRTCVGILQRLEVGAGEDRIREALFSTDMLLSG